MKFSKIGNDSNVSQQSSRVVVDEDMKRQEEQLRARDLDLQQEEEKVKVPAVGDPVTRLQDGESFDKEYKGKDGPFRYRYVPLRMGGNGGTHKPSKGSRDLIESEVSLDDLLKMTAHFYELAFQDDTLDKFIRSHSDPHGERFAKWIHQKLTGSRIWDHDCQTRDKTPQVVAEGRISVVHDRTSAHVAAWYSPKRPAKDVGRHFSLEECRVWMRLHFWAMRDSGLLEKSPSFADYYIRFIGHFVAVYERSATSFARESFRWSATPKNIEIYIQNGRKMEDVLGIRFQDAINALPDEELKDDDWPYHVASPQ